MCVRSLLAAVLLSVLADPVSAQDTDPFLRHPAVHPDGDRIAFSYQGDLWTVAADGGRAERLTIHEAYEGHPRWAPGGEQISFMSDRAGNDDLYVTDPGGSTPERLTHHSTDENMEHGPARPDIRVQNPPAVKATGEDPQLRRAVEALLEETGDDAE